MAVDIWTIILTSVCTGIGISIGNGLYDVYFKDHLKKLKKQNLRLMKLHQKLKLDYKRPWLAALLNMFLWGMGYLYVGKRKILGVLLFLIQIFIIGGYALSQGNIVGVFEGISYSFMTMIVSVLLALDAYSQARKVNAAKELKHVAAD